MLPTDIIVQRNQLEGDLSRTISLMLTRSGLPIDDEVRHSGCQYPRLARPGARDHADVMVLALDGSPGWWKEIQSAQPGGHNDP